jgi:hypothetical protein
MQLLVHTRLWRNAGEQGRQMHDADALYYTLYPNESALNIAAPAAAAARIMDANRRGCSRDCGWISVLYSTVMHDMQALSAVDACSLHRVWHIC